MENTTFLLTNLLAHKLNNQCEPIAFEQPDIRTVTSLLQLAKKHDIMPLIGTELIDNHLISDEKLRAKVQDCLCETACY